MPIFTSADNKYKPSERRVDTRLWSVRTAEAIRDVEGGWYFNGAIILAICISFVLPVLPLILAVLATVLSFVYLRSEKKLHDLPFRMPVTIDGYDGSQFVPNRPFTVSQNRPMYRGKGITFLGHDRKSGMQTWTSGNDDRTHYNVFGSTGSGKTELIHAIVFNQLVQNSGALIVDAKGDIKLYERSCTMARRFGRDADLMVITFAIGQSSRSVPQLTKPSNLFNLMLNASDGMLSELLTGLLDGAAGGDDMWKSRAISYINALTKPLVFLRDKKEIELSPSTYIDYLELVAVERFVYESEYKYDEWSTVIKPLKAYLISLPGYNPNMKGEQAQQTNEQFGYITMQLTRSINDLGYTYGHIFNSPVGEIDISDIVLNRRLLVILLPALERAPATLMMLGRLIVGSIRQMMASSLGSEVEGSVRLKVEARPTSADTVYRIIMDEVGYMITTGMSIMPAQARSLNMSMVFSAQDYTDIERGSAEEAQGIWSNATNKFVGRLVSGQHSEMWRRLEGQVGEIEQTYVEHYDRHYSVTYDVRYRMGGTVRSEKRSRVTYDEISSQQDGEFTLIAPKKLQGGISGTMAVVPIMSFYTGDLKSMGYMYVNDFVPLAAATAVPPDPQSVAQKLASKLKQGKLSEYLNNTVLAQKTNAMPHNQSAFNSLAHFAAECTEQAQSREFEGEVGDLLLEVAYGKLGTSLRSLSFDEAYDPTNLCETAEEQKALFELADISSEAAEVYADARDYKTNPAAQAQQYRTENEVLDERVIAERDLVHKQKGRAADVALDDELADAIKEHELKDDFSSLQVLATDDDTPYERMLTAARQRHQSQNSLGSRLLLSAVQSFEPIPPTETDKKQLNQLLSKLTDTDMPA